jgi:uncharacterized protein
VSTSTLDSLEAVREIIGEPSSMMPLKILDSLDEMATAYIRSSPFLMLATTGEDGTPEVSPKGDEPGFVAVEDPNTLLIPDRRGNRLIFSLQNILATGRVAAIFLVPGTDETLRVQGRAELTADRQLCERFKSRGRPALLVTRVTVERCFFHCAKAFKRSRLWDPDAWPPRQQVSFGRQAADRHGLDDEVAHQIDEAVEEDYRTNL